MAKIKLLKVINKDEVSKNGKPYIKCSIKTLDKNGQEVWINGFGNNTTKSWSEGQEIDLEVYQEEYNGKTYFKFRDVKEINLVQEIVEIKKLLSEIYTMLVFNKVDVSKEKTSIIEPIKKEEEEEVNVADIPF